MEQTSYGLRTKVEAPYEDAVSQTKEALKAEGFGVLTEIDVKATLKKKLDVDFRKYVILGACNPSFAYQTLQAETDIGLLLPCNVIVYEADDSTSIVAAVDPLAAMQMIHNPALIGIAQQVRAKLGRVIEVLGSRR